MFYEQESCIEWVILIALRHPLPELPLRHFTNVCVGTVFGIYCLDYISMLMNKTYRNVQE